MARIAGIDLPENKKIDYALTLIYGIGWERARNILKEADVSGDTRTGKLSEEEVAKIAKAVETYSVEGDLKREVRQNIQRLRDIGSYRGTRHARNLPARGQRTRSNARTKRGLRKTVGAFKKEALTKMTTAKPATNKK
ncbi:MAG: 30S ribosomal protein S13 [Candidatus Blackburnbacteria bacterium RIFCSPHIGHO2_01_FULL_44_64]|uniref:Small ribosomal subunit protein uS13 n=1 Tax=Candidatus Blackburnbacteria bacterium RIFCSPHIGHO2_02_FULL_44_20 TaxID=1797516 RepID=A0A1G1VAF6_9BACT|nr:MAG: 30S ribosomal protein S13 [Candidatus Blackburnbacteria bacterium RIFCSPHIGHO2_01_FULL_44_64]OGY11829.1 MAG: 30S ribosomal protein S13 [Candidatus Blackburnbacteria bacterium RIFCSPHIGHO2_12_FULL_44_25]OGY12366.1 MAG: 30S ribosomal protein S13 [Candidatus Blackburnbacteria bacterium RIFCSPHIGHO2_02_FULL_44_20]OGY15071.1 MAG: 30S ribosomal protein S13 [Candidatus Blackburnbacteria bacterium RIFCSPLOWO2_01_FULL_44_43]OGY16010.1 MAG: 30S ribosomal protein S13 [Candidatus Blackburnbacteria 